MDNTVRQDMCAERRNHTHNTTLDSDKCLICLSSFLEQPVATLDNCQHVYCLECILQWSKTADSCPVDRISFSVIYQRSRPGGDIQKKIKVKCRRQVVDEEQGEEEEEGLDDDVICQQCGRSDRRHRLLLCLHCDSGYHIDCLTPPLNAVPEGDWICRECEISSSHLDGCIEEEVSDGELTDLLDEIDDAVPTSSRLRPSTTNQPRASTGTRNSQRLQARTARNPTPLSQSCLHVPKYLLRASKSADTTNELVASNHGDARNALGIE